MPFALLGMAAVSGCSPQNASTATSTAQSIPQPGANVTQTIRERVAAVVKKEALAHPATAPWINDLAKASFEIAGYDLPAPAVLKTIFGAVSAFAPPDIAKPIADVLDLYTQDYTAASAIQGGSKAYLTALGQGIQDGVKQAGFSEAP